MRLRDWSGIVACLLFTALSFSQTEQQPTNPPPTGAQPTNSQSTNPEPANQRPMKPSAVAAAASASRLAHQSAPPTKVIRNHDISDGSSTSETGKSEPRPSDVAAVRAAQDRENQEEDRKVQQFEAQGKTFTNQIRVQKGKIIDLQNQVQNLRDQFYAWSDSHRHVNADICWTAEHDAEYYTSWCDVGRNLRSAMEASQGQLAQEKVRLEQMQENIRHAGYGNAVYDPD
jgi:hypothetical protein